MSDYGNATLEGWLAEEVFNVHEVPEEIVNLFEEWRKGIEQNIEEWMDSDDGLGYNLSWRGWGRGFYAIPKEDESRFDSLVESCRRLYLNFSGE